MGTKFRTLIGILTAATVIQLLVVAYVVGVEEGFNSQQYTIKTLKEQLTGLIMDFLPYIHPLRNTLFISSLIIAFCWLLVAVVAFSRNRK
jgi:ABC-type maltose transport system permease subunit